MTTLDRLASTYQKAVNYVAQGWAETRSRHPVIEQKVATAVAAYRNSRIFNINVNSLVSSVVSIPATGVASAVMESAGVEKDTMAVAAIGVDAAFFLVPFVFLHYHANRPAFVAEEATLSGKKLARDVAHIYASALPATVVFYGLGGPLQYALNSGTLPFSDIATGLAPMSAAGANQASYWISLAVSMALFNAVGALTGIFKKRDATSHHSNGTIS